MPPFERRRGVRGRGSEFGVHSSQFGVHSRARPRRRPRARSHRSRFAVRRSPGFAVYRTEFAAHSLRFRGGILCSYVVKKATKPPGRSDPCSRSSPQSKPIGHALGNGLVQPIFRPPSRRSRLASIPSLSCRDAGLKMLCVNNATTVVLERVNFVCMLVALRYSGF
jgi:hypothetical protein